MTAEQIYNLIERNKVVMVQLQDTNANVVLEESASTPAQLVEALRGIMDSFAGYRKLSVRGKTSESSKANWTKGFTWQLEFPSAPVAGTPANNNAVDRSQYIGAVDYVNMMRDMMEKNFSIQKELMEKSIQLSNNDPTKWLPFVQTVAPMLGLNTGGIQGPPQPAAKTKELKFGGTGEADFSKMNDDQITQLIGGKLNELSKKIKAWKMYCIIDALNNIPDLDKKAEQIAKAFQSDKLDMALQYFN